MTHKDIYTKFMIEYDKANVTSSYPSLTEYEVATVLDKAYHALIAQKITGNNVRRVALEGDLKSVTDIQPLIVKKNYEQNEITSGFAENFETIDYDDIDNTMSVKIPSDFLYYIGCDIKKEFYPTSKSIGGYNDSTEKKYTGPIDQGDDEYQGPPVRSRRMHVKLVSHQMAENFKASASNIPWVKNPVCYIEDDTIYIVVDSYDKPKVNFCELTYIKTPNKFAKDFSEIEKFISESPIYSDAWNSIGQKLSYFQPTYTVDKSILDESEQNDYEKLLMMESIEKNFYTFECNDTMAEELISLAVAFALENVESQRLNSKLNMRGLEA